MIRQIVRDPFLLGQRAEDASAEDAGSVGRDLRDTLREHRDRCVGMAANMIGSRKRIIIVCTDTGDVVMLNPVLLAADDPYEAEEGCLSLEGLRRTTRYRRIEVEYLDEKWKRRRRHYSGRTAQIIQHEMDHLSGILI